MQPASYGISFNEFCEGARDFFFWFYEFTNSVYPFTDYPEISMYAILEGLILANFAWLLFPLDGEFGDIRDDDFDE